MNPGEPKSPSSSEAAPPRGRVLSLVPPTVAGRGASAVAAPSGTANRAPKEPRREHEEDSFAATTLSDVIDRSLHASLAYFTLGLSPAALGSAYLDWATHLAASPGKQAQLAVKASRKALRLARWMGQCALEGGASEPCIEPLPQDHRFVGEAWRRWPYNLLYQSFLLQQQWWHNATTSVRGVTQQHENAVDFMSRQLLIRSRPSTICRRTPS